MTWSCETQRLRDQKLSSTIFTCCLSVPHGDISSLWCFRPYKPYIFWKLLVPGYQNWYYQVFHTQIHKYKYTNTQIQHITKCQKDPTCGIFLKRGLFRGIKNDIHMCQTRKYKNPITQLHKYTNTQIRHMAKCQKDPTCGIFLKRGLFKDVFWVSHSCTRSSWYNIDQPKYPQFYNFYLKI